MKMPSCHIRLTYTDGYELSYTVSERNCSSLPIFPCIFHIKTTSLKKKYTQVIS